MGRVIASIEARMGASRLPGKVLADINGAPALARMVRRLRRCRTLDGVIVATTTNRSDDAIVAWAESEGLPCYRGSEEDVLARVAEAQRSMGAETVVELCGDCPLTDPEVIDLGVDTFRANNCDVVSTTWKPSFPQGIDVQVFPLRSLEEVARTVDDPAIREHVSLYFYEHPDSYRIVHLTAPARWRYPGYRFLLDYPDDLRLFRELYARLEPEHGDDFGLDEILALVRREPGLLRINSDCGNKPVR